MTSFHGTKKKQKQLLFFQTIVCSIQNQNEYSDNFAYFFIKTYAVGAH